MRRNWNCAGATALPSIFSSLQPVSTSSESGVEAAEVILVRRVRIGIGEEVTVQSDLGVGAIICIDPVDSRALDLAVVGRISAAAVGIVGGKDLDDVAVFVLDAARAGYEIRALRRHSGPAG